MSFSVNVLLFILLVVIFFEAVIIMGQNVTIKRNGCKNRCDKYNAKDETGFFFKVESAVEWFKSNWTTFVLYTAASSIILLFLLTIVFPQKDTLSIMNNWVGLILGFAALFMSIASMVLSFYNVEQSHAMELRTEKINQKIEDKLGNIDELKESIEATVQTIDLIRNDLGQYRKELTEYHEETKGIIMTKEGPKKDENWDTEKDFTKNAYNYLVKKRDENATSEK